MAKTKSATKKEKAGTAKKVTARKKSSAKPIKLGGVPNQGSVQ